MRPLLVLRIIAPCALALAVAATSLPASARGSGFHGGFGHGGGHYGGARHSGGRGWHGGGWGWGLGLGAGIGWGFDSYWGWPGYELPYADLYSPTAPAVQQGAPPPPQYYYCDSPSGYYPYVTTCQTPWRAVSPVPPTAP